MTKNLKKVPVKWVVVGGNDTSGYILAVIKQGGELIGISSERPKTQAEAHRLTKALNNKGVFILCREAEQEKEQGDRPKRPTSAKPTQSERLNKSGY